MRPLMRMFFSKRNREPNFLRLDSDLRGKTKREIAARHMFCSAAHGSKIVGIRDSGGPSEKGLNRTTFGDLPDSATFYGTAPYGIVTFKMP